MEDVEVIAEGIVNLAVQDVVNRLAQTLKDKYGIELIIKVGDGANKTSIVKDSYDVILTKIGDGGKIAVVKAVKDTCGLSTSDAVHLVERAPVTIKTGMLKNEAESIKNIIENTGAKVELK